MKKIISFFIILVAIGSVFALVFLSVLYDNTSAALGEANIALKAGDKAKAYEIYFDIVQKDTSCEEAYVKLAELSEDKIKYKDAAYFWSRAFSLNQLEKSYEKRMYQSMIVAKTDILLIARYLAAADKSSIDEEILYNMGLSFIRTSLLDMAKEMRKTILKDSKYGELLESYVSLSTGGIHTSAGILSDLRKRDIKDETFNAYLNFNSAVASLIMDELSEAKKYLENVPTDMMNLRGDSLIIEGKLLFKEGKPKEALKAHAEAALLQSMNMNILIESAELAMTLSESQTISKLALTIEATDERHSQLIKYFKALELAALQDWENSSKNLAMSGFWLHRTMAKILDFKCACALNDLKKARSAAGIISPKSVSASVRIGIAGNLSNFLNGMDFEAGRPVAEMALSFDPENFAANKFMCLYFYSVRDMEGAWTHGVRAFELNPKDDEVYSIASLAALSLDNHSSCSSMAAVRLKNNPDDINALLFTARSYSLKKDLDEAESAYASILTKTKDASVVREAGMFFTENKFARSEDFINELEQSTEPEKLALAKSLRAEKALIDGDKSSALKYLKEGVAIMPGDIDMAVKLAELYFSSGDLQNAKNTLMQASEISKNPTINFQYAILLSRGDSNDISKALELLESLPEKYSQTVGYNLLMADIKEKSGDSNSAIDYAFIAVKIAPDSPYALKILTRLLGENSRKREALEEIAKSSLIGRDKEVQNAFFELSADYLNGENLPKEKIPFLQDLLKAGSLIHADSPLWREISDNIKSELNQRKEKRLNERINVESI